jgi:hypothetical protein
MNLISAVKLIILLFIVFTGFAVLGGGTRIENPRQNFNNSQFLTARRVEVPIHITSDVL